MLNQVMLIGRIINIKKQETEESAKYVVVRLSIPRSFKNSEGLYDTDYVNVKIIGTMAEQCAQYIEKGDMIGIKGRLTTTKDDHQEILVEKLTFLSSKKSEVEQNV